MKIIDGTPLEIVAISEKLAEVLAAEDSLRSKLNEIQAEFNSYWLRECQNSFGTGDIEFRLPRQ